jgi:integrase
MMFFNETSVGRKGGGDVVRAIMCNSDIRAETCAKQKKDLHLVQHERTQSSKIEYREIEIDVRLARPLIEDALDYLRIHLRMTAIDAVRRRAGVSLYKVRQLLGHSSITVTERYAHLAPSSLDRAVSVLENRNLPDKVTAMRPKSQ